MTGFKYVIAYWNSQTNDIFSIGIVQDYTSAKRCLQEALENKAQEYNCTLQDFIDRNEAGYSDDGNWAWLNDGNGAVEYSINKVGANKKVGLIYFVHTPDISELKVESADSNAEAFKLMLSKLRSVYSDISDKDIGQPAFTFLTDTNLSVSYALNTLWGWVQLEDEYQDLHECHCIIEPIEA